MKRLLLAFAAVSLAVFAISCSDDDNGDGNGANGEPTSSSSTPANAAQATSASGSQTTYPLTVENCGTEFTFNEEPTTIATGYEPSFELVVGAGLAGRIILTSQFDEIETAGFANPEQQAAYESVKHHDDPYYLPKKEAILALSPDVAVDVGDFSFKPEDGFATPDELVDAGIMPYKLGGWCSDESRTDFKIEILYNDVLTLGKIFNENAKAQQLVDQMKASFDGTKEKTEGLERPRVYMYDSGEGPLNSYGKGMSSIAVEAAGGDLIFKDQPWFWEASIEEVAASNPDAFVIVNYNPGATGEEKFEFLCTVVPDSKACKEKRYVLVPAVAFHPGYRFAFAVEDIARMLHPEAFE